MWRHRHVKQSGGECLGHVQARGYVKSKRPGLGMQKYKHTVATCGFPIAKVRRSTQ